MNVLDMLSGALSGNSQQTQQVAQQVGATPEQTSSAMQAAIPMILGALHQNTQQQGGEEQLGQALQRHDGGTLDNFQQGQLPDTGEGQRIVQHAFGNDADAAAQSLAQRTGLNAGSAMQILATVAPLILSALGRSQNQGGMGGAGGIGGMLGGLLGSLGGGAGAGGLGSGGLGSGGLGGMLGGLLGGGQEQGQYQQGQTSGAQNSAGQDGGLGGMLGSVLGGGAGAGGLGSGGLGGMLGGLLGGGQEQQDQVQQGQVQQEQVRERGDGDTRGGSLGDLTSSAEQDTERER